LGKRKSIWRADRPRHSPTRLIDKRAVLRRIFKWPRLKGHNNGKKEKVQERFFLLPQSIKDKVNRIWQLEDIDMKRRKSWCPNRP